MEPIEVGKLDQILSRLDAQDTQLASIFALSNETNVVVKDILQGRQLSEWITDLATSGTSSATYGNSDRMNALIADSDACRNVDVAQYLLDWAVTHDKAGTYYGSALGSVSGVTWTSLTTANSVMGNSAAFTAIAANNTAFTASMNNATCRTAIYNNAATTGSIIVSSAIAMSILTQKRQWICDDTVESYTGNWFLLSACSYNGTVTVTLKAGGTYQTSYFGAVSSAYSQQEPVNKFMTKVSTNSSRKYLCFYYVDFS